MPAAKKFFNDKSAIVDETLDGLVRANRGKLSMLPSGRAVVWNAAPNPKVGLLIGGGSGHEPLFSGFVGKNLADGAVAGNIFAAPTPDIILEATQAVNKGLGVLYLYGNYSGDNLNFDIAAEMADQLGISVKTVRIWDDVASAPRERMEDRRGIAGDLFVIKVAGGAAARLDSLDEVDRVTAKARDHTRSIGVAAAAGTFPETGKPTFELPDDEMEIGMGLHGEPGVIRSKMMSADDVVNAMMERILADLPFQAGDEVCVLVNDLGATTAAELLIIYRRVDEILTTRGLQIHDVLIGSYCTSQEMAGFSISLLKLDDELKAFYDLPVQSLGFTKG